MELTEVQKRYLRGLAHALRPCIQVGSAGVSPAVTRELSTALDHHELLKVKVRAGSREQREAVVAGLLGVTGAALVTRIGNVAVLYRPSRDQPRIVLPARRPAG